MITRDEYEAKRQVRYERLITAAQNAAAKSEAMHAASARLGDMIPLGQPILIGHHSESRARRHAERIQNNARKGYELYLESQQLKARADAAANNGAIYSDDPDAIEKIEAELNEKQLEVDRMKAINKYQRSKNATALEAVGLTPDQAAAMLDPYREYGHFPTFSLSNRNANIRRLKERIEQIKRRQAIAAHTETINGIAISQNPDEMRTQIKFSGRPSSGTIDTLKSNGFRWSPTSGCWQRLIGTSAFAAAKRIAQGVQS